MNRNFAAAMGRAVRLTRALDVAEATGVIQAALAGRTSFERPQAAQSASNSAPRLQHPRLQLAGKSRAIDQGPAEPERSAEPASPEVRRAEAATDPALGGPRAAPRTRRPLAEALRLLREGRLSTDAMGPLPGMTGGGTLRTSRPPVLPDGARFLTRSFGSAAGTRTFKLYIPASAPDAPRGLIVMLHGCKQDPDDFAAGTKMNAVAERTRAAGGLPGPDQLRQCLVLLELVQSRRSDARHRRAGDSCRDDTSNHGRVQPRP